MRRSESTKAMRVKINLPEDVDVEEQRSRTKKDVDSQLRASDINSSPCEDGKSKSTVKKGKNGNNNDGEGNDGAVN